MPTTQPTTIPSSDCPPPKYGLNITNTTPTGTTIGNVLISAGQPRFTIPLLTIPSVTGSAIDGFTLGLNYLTGFDGATSSDGTVGLNWNYTQNATLTASGLDVVLQNGDKTQIVFTSTDGINYSSAGTNAGAILQRYNAGTYLETFTVVSRRGVTTTFAGIVRRWPFQGGR